MLLLLKRRGRSLSLMLLGALVLPGQDVVWHSGTGTEGTEPVHPVEQHLGELVRNGTRACLGEGGQVFNQRCLEIQPAASWTDRLRKVGRYRIPLIVNQPLGPSMELEKSDVSANWVQ